MKTTLSERTRDYYLGGHRDAANAMDIGEVLGLFKHSGKHEDPSGLTAKLAQERIRKWLLGAVDIEQVVDEDDADDWKRRDKLFAAWVDGWSEHAAAEVLDSLYKMKKEADEEIANGVAPRDTWQFVRRNGGYTGRSGLKFPENGSLRRFIAMNLPGKPLVQKAVRNALKAAEGFEDGPEVVRAVFRAASLTDKQKKMVRSIVNEAMSTRSELQWDL